MKTLVTGATGFLGGRLAELLAARGDELRVLVRPTSAPEAVSALRALRAEIVLGRLEQADSLPPAVAGVRRVFHCAALSSDWGRRESFARANVLGTRNLLAAARDAGCVERLVHVSTTDVYGYRAVPGAETAPRRAVGLPYNQSKCRAEEEVEAAQRQGLAATVVRPATIYGPRSKDWILEAARLLLAERLLLVGGGGSRAGLIYVDDVAAAMITAAGAPQAAGKVYNLRHPEDATWREFFMRLAAGIGAPPPRRSIPRWAALAGGLACEAAARAAGSATRPLLTRHAVHLTSRDQGFPAERVRRELGFTPAVGLQEGMARTLAWLGSPEGRAALERTGCRPVPPPSTTSRVEAAPTPCLPS